MRPPKKNDCDFLITTHVQVPIFCLVLCGKRFKFRFRVSVCVRARIYDKVRVRAMDKLKVLLTRLTLAVVHAFDGHLYVSG